MKQTRIQKQIATLLIERVELYTVDEVFNSMNIAEAMKTKWRNTPTQREVASSLRRMCDKGVLTRAHDIEKRRNFGYAMHYRVNQQWLESQ